MEAEAPVNEVDDQGRNALHWAVLRDDVGELRQAVEAGFTVNDVTHRGDSGLHFAAWNNRECTLPVLLELGGDASLRNDSGNTPFDNALRKRHWGCAMRLLEAWLPDLGVDKNGKNACHYFAEAIRGTAGSSMSSNLQVMFERLPIEGWDVPDKKQNTAWNLLSNDLQAYLRAHRLRGSWQDGPLGVVAPRPRM